MEGMLHSTPNTNGGFENHFDDHGAGLISAAPGKRNGQLQASARQVEGMVRAKMEQKEYIILCLEDSNDWSNATTRRLVMLVGCWCDSVQPLPLFSAGRQTA